MFGGDGAAGRPYLALGDSISFRDARADAGSGSKTNFSAQIATKGISLHAAPEEDST
jgi:hypothetical protein